MCAGAQTERARAPKSGGKIAGAATHRAGGGGGGGDFPSIETLLKLGLSELVRFPHCAA